MPKLRIEFLRILMAFAAYFGFKVEQINVPDAYLKGDLNGTIYIEISLSYDLSQRYQKRDYVLRLLRPLYGLKQSGRNWNKKAKKHLKSIEFEPITRDNCVFFNKSTHVIIVLYVDNLLIFAKSITYINEVKSQLFNEYKIKNIEKTSFILKIRIRHEVERKQPAMD